MDEIGQRLYLALHRGTAGDVEHYVRVCRGAPSVLELGVGDGRILSRISAPTRMGLDAEPGMVEAARTSVTDAVLVTGDMENFQLGRSFDRILIPASALFALPSREAMVRCLRCCRRHLQEGGELWLDAYASDAFHEDSEPDDDDGVELEYLTDVDLDGRKVSVFEANRWDRTDQTFDVIYWFDLGDRAVEQRLIHHYLTSDQLREVAREADLEVRDLFGGFEREPFARDSALMVARLVPS